MLDQQLVSMLDSTFEIDTLAFSQPKGSTSMPIELLDALDTLPDNLSITPMSEDTMPTLTLSPISEETAPTLIMLPTPEETIPTPTLPLNSETTPSPIQRLRSLYAHNLSDYGNAHNFVAQFGPQVRYVPTLGWLLYTGTHWQLDTTDQIFTLAQASLQSYYETANSLADTDAALCTRLLKHAQRSQSSSRIKALLLLARSCPGVTLLPAALDSDPNLLTVLNGTLDLATLELQPHNPIHYITRFIPIAYDPDAISPAWTSFLDLLTNSDLTLQNYLQLAIGYTLTGHTSERLSFLLHGPDQRAHQLFLSLMNQIFASYAQHLPVLKARSLNTSLIGARLLTTSTSAFLESCHYPTLAALLDADPIVPRSVALSSATFTPQAKLWLSSSVLPQTPLNLSYLSHNLKIIPLTSTFNHRTEQQPTTQLTSALPAILAWAVQGAHQWLASALIEPACVSAATLAFQEEQDTLASFLEACCTQNSTASVPARELYQAYAHYTRSQGQTPLSEHKFSPLILARNFTRSRQSLGRTYHDLALRLPLSQLITELSSTSVSNLKRLQTASPLPKSPQSTSLFPQASLSTDLSSPNSSHPTHIHTSRKLKNKNILM